MEIFEFRVRVSVGIHVRNAMLLSQKSGQYQCDVYVYKGERRANAKRLMELMILRVRCGDNIRFLMEGSDEKKAAVEIREFCERNF